MPISAWTQFIIYWCHLLGVRKCVRAEICMWFGIYGVVHKSWLIKVMLHNIMHSTYDIKMWHFKFPTGQNSCVQYIYIYTHTHTHIQVSHEFRSLLQEGVPYVKLYQYNPKHLYPKSNGCGGNDHRKVWTSVGSMYCTRLWRHTRPLHMPGNKTSLCTAVSAW
jgi:hypothetical protein